VFRTENRGPTYAKFVLTPDTSYANKYDNECDSDSLNVILVTGGSNAIWSRKRSRAQGSVGVAIWDQGILVEARTVPAGPTFALRTAFLATFWKAGTTDALALGVIPNGIIGV